MVYPPIRIIHAGLIHFEQNGDITMNGFTFDMGGRPFDGNKFLYTDEIAAAVLAYTVDRISRKVKNKNLLSEPVVLVDPGAEREAELLAYICINQAQAI